MNIIADCCKCQTNNLQNREPLRSKFDLRMLAAISFSLHFYTKELVDCSIQHQHSILVHHPEFLLVDEIT